MCEKNLILQLFLWGSLKVIMQQCLSRHKWKVFDKWIVDVNLLVKSEDFKISMEGRGKIYFKVTYSHIWQVSACWWQRGIVWGWGKREVGLISCKDEPLHRAAYVSS